MYKRQELSIQHLDKYGTSIPCEQLSLFQEYSDRIRAVSYTHLDVYKRQFIDFMFPKGNIPFIKPYLSPKIYKTLGKR